MASLNEGSRHAMQLPLSGKARSPDPHTQIKLIRLEQPPLEAKMQEGSMLKSTPRYGEIDGLRQENNELRDRLKSLAKHPVITHQEVVKLRDRIIEQERIIAEYRVTSEKLGGGRSTEELRQIVAERDRTIDELRKIIEKLSSVQIHPSKLQPPNSFNDRIRTLSIENERLGLLVERLSGAKYIPVDMTPEVVALKTENDNLKLELALLRVELPEARHLQHRMQAQSKELACLEQKNRLLEEENRTLERFMGQQSIMSVEKRRLEEEVVRLNNALRQQFDSTTSSKQSIAKAKEHYDESLRMFKSTVQEEVAQELKRFEDRFLAMKRKLDSIEHLAMGRQRQQVQFESPIVSRFNPNETTKKLLTLTSFEDTRGATKQLSGASVQQHVREPPFRHEVLQTTADHLVSRDAERLQAIIAELEQQLAAKNEVCANQQRLFDQLSRELEEYRERSLQAINSQFETDRATRQREIEELKRLHRSEMDSLRGALENELIDVVNSNAEKVDALRDKIHQQNLDLLRLQGEADRLKSELRLARTDSPIAQLMHETRGLLERNTSKSSEPQLRLERVTEVVSRTDSEAESKFVAVVDTNANTFYGERSDLRLSVEKFKQVMDNLIVENGMIPQLKNRIQVLEAELLRLEQNVGDVNRRMEILKDE